LIRTKSEQEILTNIANVKGGNNLFDFRNSKPASFFISNQFAKLFNSYTQAFNKIYNRTGSLFEHPFRRIPVSNNQYYTGLIHYIHSNPQKHGICDDFTHYPYSSYAAFLLQKKTQLMRNEVLDWFGNKEQFVKFHQQNIKANVEEVYNLFDV